MLQNNMELCGVTQVYYAFCTWTTCLKYGSSFAGVQVCRVYMNIHVRVLYEIDCVQFTCIYTESQYQ